MENMAYIKYWLPTKVTALIKTLLN